MGLQLTPPETSSYRGEEEEERGEEEMKERGRGEEDEGYLDDISNRQEVSSREDVLFVLLIFTLPLHDVNRRKRRNFTCIQLLHLLLTQTHLSMTSDLLHLSLCLSVHLSVSMCLMCLCVWRGGLVLLFL